MRGGARRRRVWLWLVVGAGALVVGLPAGYWGWGVYEEVSLAREVAGYRDAGEPVMPDALRASVDVPGPNRAAGLREAWRGIDDQGQDYHWLRGRAWKSPLPAEDARRLRDILAKNRGMLERVAEATRRPGFRWESQPGPFLDYFEHREVAKAVVLSDLMAGAILLSHQDGDDREAMEGARQLIVLGRTLGRVPTPLANAAGQLVESKATGALRRILPGLPVGQDGAGARDLVELLADRGPSDEAWRGMSRGLRVETLAFKQFALSNRAAFFAMFRPMVASDAREILRLTDRVMTAGLAADWPAAAAVDTASPFDMSGASLLHEFGQTVTPALEKRIKPRFEQLTWARVTAVALACRAYAEAHDRRWPSGLGDLVPEYFAELPMDPMASGGRAVGFVGGARPVVYSIGPDGRDDGGDASKDFAVPLGGGASN